MCKICRNLRKQKIYNSNLEKMHKQSHDSYLRNIEHRKIYLLQNKEKINLQHLARYKTDSRYRLIKQLQHAVWRILNGIIEDSFIIPYIGCDHLFLRKWFSELFYDDMSFENNDTWDIDHCKSISSFNIEDENSIDIFKCFNWKNLHPLKPEENNSKWTHVDLQMEKSLKNKAEEFLIKYKDNIILENGIYKWNIQI